MNNSNENINTLTIVQIPNYQIKETIYSGSRTLVYRAIRINDRLPVVIKLLKNDYPTFSELVQFRNQYTIAKNLCQPGIIQTYSLEPYQNSYALVMEDFGGISLKDYFTSVEMRYIAFLQQFLELAIALCNALDILYRDRIIHKDIKPANILINPETKQVKLIDFSIASLLPRETQTLINPNVLEGTLAYISPEQTGRMNRGIDYRTDFYSLGVTFYELLTGKLPFQSNDLMELVHGHIAKAAPLVQEINPQIPSVLSDIVNKLMAKNAEDRYQSALGLKFDLETSLHQLQETGEIRNFEIGQRDLCDRFIIPDKLYGRETEVSTLLQAFERIANPPESPLGKGGHRGVEMMLVAGFSGIGKTAVVNEVHKPIVRQRGYFIKGKYDQFQRNIPFSAFVQAFRDLMGQLLSESDAQLAQWKAQILATVGDNGQVLIDVIPELEYIIGQQPPAPQLSGNAAQNLFNLLFQKFIAVFATQEHPLVMFLDDLQWADSASLNLMQVLLSQVESGYLLLLGAYRDNEVFPAHPLMLTIADLGKAKATIETLTLAPLSQESLNVLVADTLHCNENIAQPLTELVYQKTQGNPFFATQFLKALHEEGWIAFDPTIGYWQCDIAVVRSLALTGDVVEFMALQLQKLPAATQAVLKLAACIGAQFDLQTLAIVFEKSLVDTAIALWKALQEGLIIPNTEVYKFFTQSDSVSVVDAVVNPTYRFLHDRVQQAAYHLIPEKERVNAHYHIGQSLHQKLAPDAREERIFEVINQLNYGVALIEAQPKRDELAQLNLVACRKARMATAYQSAYEYATIGLTLLGNEAWQRQYELTLQFHELGAEVASFCGQFDQMNQWIDTAIHQVKTPLEQVGVYLIRIQAFVFQNQYLAAIETAQLILQELGVELPREFTPDHAQQATLEIKDWMGDRSVEDLLRLPTMVDAEKLAISNIAANVIAPCYLAGSPLYAVVVALHTKLSLQYGHSPSSAHGYVSASIGFYVFLQDDTTAAQFCDLAYRLDSMSDDKNTRAKVFTVIGLFLRHRQSHLRETLSIHQTGYQAGLESGNLIHTGHNGYGFCLNAYWSGQPLNEIEPQIRAYRQQLFNLNQVASANYCSIFWEIALFLLNNPDNLELHFDQADYEDNLVAQSLAADDLTRICFFYLHRATLRFLFREIDQAKADISEAKKYILAGSAYISEAGLYFYDSLIALATIPESPAEVEAQQQRVQENQLKLQHWAEYAPMNYLHKWHLVEAEKHRILGQKADAMALYDRAIALAKANEYIQEEALANELAAKFYLDWGKQRIAQEYITEAYYGYARWGAKAKVADLERRYPQLLAPILQQSRSPLSTNETIFALGSVTSKSSATSSSSVSDSLDLKAILKASQTISGEIELEKLLSSLLSIVIENAGADKCVLMLLRDNHLLLEGLITVGTKPVVLQRIPVEESQDIPLKLIYKVKHNRQTVVLLDATADPTLANDPYIMRQQSKSILCSPILHQGKLLGILYLENNLATGAFTSDRIELLNLLCAQAAISLENARLYEREQIKNQELEESIQCLKDTQSQLQSSQEFLRLVIDNIPQLVFWKDRNSTFLGCNISAAQATNLESPEQIVGKKDRDFCTPEEADWYQHYDRRVIESGEAELHVIETRKEADDTQRWLDANIIPLHDLDNNVMGILVTAEDISDRKLAELALQQKSLDLQQALTDLQNAQLQMVQSEKMSALGNLVAGVAHEMNNPLGFIAASLKQAKPTFTDIIEHLKLYQQSLPNKADEILDHAEEIDLDYSLEDLPKMIDSMSIACDRLKNISTSLRTFSRADQDYKVPFNIHEGIDSTILILKHRLKANEQRPAIEVVTNYGNLPQIECFPGQLNQVFMNILANAIDALDESNHGRRFAEIKANPNCITITTSVENNLVKIAIADNGKGMNEQVKSKVFDHLFTTKAVGKGTGLGLAIAHQIVVEKHSGSIQVNSIMGTGTEFIITLPTQA